MMPKRLFLILAGCLVSLLLIETGLRTASYFYAAVRASRASGDAGGGRYLICCFGDSWTNGGGDYPGGGGYPQRLEMMLNASFPRRGFTVVNCAGSAFNSSLTLLSVKKNLERFKPDLVIIWIGANDHWNYSEVDPRIIAGYRAHAVSRYWLIRTEIFLSRLKTYALLKLGIMNLKHRFCGKRPDRGDKELRAMDQFIDLRCEIVELYDRLQGKMGKEDSDRIRNFPGIVQSELITRFNLEEIISCARAKGTKIVFQNYPRHYVRPEILLIIRDVAGRNGVPVVDNCSVFGELVATEGYGKFFIPDGHPNAAGYDVIAGNVFKTLRDSDALD